MASYPRKDKDARTGSNLRGEPLLGNARKVAADLGALHHRLARERHRDIGKLVSRRDLRRMDAITFDLVRDWRESSARTGGDSARIDALKLATRRRIDRLVRREVAGTAKALGVRRAQLGEHARIAESFAESLVSPHARVEWGEVATLTDATEFVAPFTSFDVQTIDDGGFVVRDDSFARPQIGHLVNNFDFDQDENTSFSDGLWGLLTHGFVSSWAACGVAFTTPREGRLEVSAILRNVYNKLMFSVSDKFGFSDAEVDIFLELFVAIVRGTKVIVLPTLLRHTGLVSHGSDLAFAESDLDDVVPFTVTGQTQERFNANESVLVLAGSRVTIHTIIDDMHAKVDAVLWWHLQKLVIGMAEDVFA